MRVTYYTDSSHIGGAELTLARLVAAVDAQLEVTVLGTDRALVERIAEGRPGCEHVAVPPVRSKWDLAGFSGHLRVIRRLRPDVLHANLRTAWSCQYALAAALVTAGVASVGTLHSILPPRNRRQAALNRITLSRLDRLVAVSRTAADSVRTYAGLPAGRIQVIENGVMQEPITQWRIAPAPVIGSIGRLTSEKRYDLLIDAVAELPEATCVLVGDGPERRALERRASERGVSERVRFTGWQDDSARWLGAFDVFVLPSDREAASLALAEAMVAGLPAVASDIPAITELVGDGDSAVLFEAGNATALAAALRSLLADPERREALGRRARVTVHGRFSIESMARAYSSLYAQVSGRP